jgi:uncharacterized protein
MRIQLLNGLADADISALDWDALVQEADPDNPFIEHAFLSGLEKSRSVGVGTGWSPRFVTAVDESGRLLGAIPAYLKQHSYGEFVFDWGWAGASERAGIPYYPKLVAAIPFTPATGNRILTRQGENTDAIRAALIEGLMDAARKTGASSAHVLFCTRDEQDALSKAEFAARTGYQYHWHNRPDKPYGDSSEYLGAFRSQNRKQIRKERERAESHGLQLQTIEGAALSESDWQALWELYLANADRHGSEPYLTPAFFTHLREHFAHRVVVSAARQDGAIVAGTLNFQKGGVLYGRYWGTQIDAEMLHFELCYHRLIDRAIEHKLKRFEAGAQGEHKMKRGLLPVPTHSAHWIRHAGLRNAVGEFLREESVAVARHIQDGLDHSPFAQTP